MMRLMERQKGAISIFLVIILLPMLTIGCLMVDMSRIHLARSLVSSAGDLTLNTGLTCYDNVLKDMYGLFASSQDYETLMANLEDYYKNSISASGLSEEDSNNYVQQIMDYLGGIETEEGITDLLQVEVTGVENTLNSEASLVNTALMKSQIVNFMKYRGPIDMGLGFLDSLKSFTTIGEQMEVIEKRKAYYTVQQSVIEQCQTAWVNLYNYNILNLTETSFTEMGNKLKAYETEYKFINQNIIRDYFEGYSYFQKRYHTYYQNDSFYFKSDRPYQISEVSSVGSKEALESYAKKVITALDSYDASLSSPDVKKLFINDKTGIYEIQRVIQYNRDVERSVGYGYTVKNLYDAYETYLSAKAAVEEKIADYEDDIEDLNDQIAAVPSTAYGAQATINALQERIAEIEDEIEELEEWLSEVSSEYDTRINQRYNPIMTKFSEITVKMLGTINGQSTITYGDKSGTYNNDDLVIGSLSTAKAKAVGEELSKFYKSLDSGIEFLTAAKSNLSVVVDAVKEGGSLTNAEGSWKQSASVDAISGMSVSEQNLAEIESVHEFINETDVNELIAHLDGAIESLKKAKKEIEGYTYGTKMIKDIQDVETVLSALEEAGHTTGLLFVSIKSSELNDTVSSIFTKAYQPNPTGLTKEWADKKKDHIEIEKGEHKFYAFLKSNFSAVTDENKNYDKLKEDKDKELKAKEESLNSYSDKASSDASKGNGTNSGSKIAGASNLPSSIWPTMKATMNNPVNMDLDNKEDTSGTLITMFKELGNCLANMGVTFRDDLFIASYIMNMFSYDTKEKEAIWEANGSNMKLSEVTAALDGTTKTNVNGSTSYVYGTDGQVTLPSNMGNVQKEMLTMTGVPISPQNNVDYLSEVEYVVFGENGTTKTYGTIYGIRFAFNTIYAFSDSSIREGARGIAMAIFGTPPLTFLVPIAQAAIIIGVALAESALDLLCIQNGMAVPIYKNKNTWMLSFENLFNTAKDVLVDTAVTAGKEMAGKVIDHSAEKLNEYLNMTSEELKNFSTTQFKELNASVTGALNTAVEQYAGTAVDQLITLCQKAKMLKDAGQLEDKNGNQVDEITYIKSALTDWVNGEGDAKDSLIYLAKKEAVQYIIDNGYISTMLSKLEGFAEGAESTLASYKSMADKLVLSISEEINKVGSTINNFISETTTKICNSVTKGADELKKAVNDGIDGLGDKLSSGTKTDPNVGVVASLYSFQYSDYLQLFLLISLLANQDRVLMNTGDVIQVNMSNQKESGTVNSYELQKAYIYLRLNVTAEVKPLFLKIPFIQDETEGLDMNNRNWYSIQYNAIQGY